MKNAINLTVILSLFSAGFFGCSEDTVESVGAVVVEVTVTNHLNQLPVYDALVEIVSQGEAPLYPQIKGNTSPEGLVELVSDSEHLRPEEAYNVRVLYNNENTFMAFSVPEDPNTGNDYFIEVDVII